MTVGERKPTVKSVRLAHPTTYKRSSNARGRRPATSTGTYSDRPMEQNRETGYSSDPEPRPSIRPKSVLRTTSGGTQPDQDRNYTSNDDDSVKGLDISDNRKRNSIPSVVSSLLEH